MSEAQSICSPLADEPFPVLWSRPQPSVPVYILSMTSYGVEYPFGEFGSAILAMLPPGFSW